RSEHRAIPGTENFKGAPAVAADANADAGNSLAAKILEACGGRLHHIPDVAGQLVAVASVLGNNREAVVHIGVGRRVHGFGIAEQIAGDPCWKITLTHTSRSTDSAGGHFGLRNAAVGADLDGLDAALAAEIGAVCVPVVESVPRAGD